MTRHLIYASPVTKISSASDLSCVATHLFFSQDSSSVKDRGKRPSPSLLTRRCKKSRTGEEQNFNHRLYYTQWLMQKRAQQAVPKPTSPFDNHRQQPLLCVKAAPRLGLILVVSTIYASAKHTGHEWQSAGLLMSVTDAGTGTRTCNVYAWTCTCLCVSRALCAGLHFFPVHTYVGVGLWH